MSGFAINRSLRRADFPVTMWAVRSDNDQPVWGVTLMAPPGNVLVPLRVPPVATWVGVPVDIITKTAQGVVVRARAGGA
jgi:hypothetical protein